MRTPKVFLSYSHHDQIWQERLGRHLGVLEKQGCLELWTDCRLRAGAQWRETILGVIGSAQVAAMLLSADFLRSDFVLDVEVPLILKRWSAGEMRVVPVLARDCTWEAVSWLTALQIRPWDAVPLAAHKGHRLDKVLAEIAREIGQLAAGSSPSLFGPA